MRPFHSLCLVGAQLLGVVAFTGQDLGAQSNSPTAPESVDPFERMMLAARRAIGFEKNNEALLALLQAQERLAQLWGRPDGDTALDDSRRDDLLELLRKVDPQREAREQIEAEIVESTIKLTRTYLRKKHPETADAWIRRVASLDPKATAKQSRAIEKRLDRARAKRLAAEEKARAHKLEKKAPKPLLETVKFEERIGYWVFKDLTVISPTMEELRGEYAYFRTTSGRHQDGRISMIVDMGRKPASIAFSFGSEGQKNYVFEVHTEEFGGKERFQLHVGTSSGQDYQRLSSAYVSLPFDRPQRAVRLGIEVEGLKIRSVFQDEVVSETDATRTPYGNYGFMIPSYSKHEGRITFRELRIDPVGTRVDPAPAKATEQESEESVADAIAGRVEAAEQLIDEKRGDEAVAALTAIERELLELEDVQFATLLRKARKLLDDNDPCRKDLVEYEKELAQRLLKLADLYEAERPLGALVYLRRASFLDPDRAEARYLKARQGLEPALMAAFGLPAEPEAELLTGAMKRFLEQSIYPGGKDAWDDDANVLLCRPRNDRVAMVIARESLPSSGRMRVQVLAENTSVFGLVTRFDSIDDLDMLWVRDRARTSELLLERWSQGQWATPIRQEIRFEPSARRTWRTIELEWSPESARARFGLGPWFELPSDRFAHGQRFGLAASSGSERAEVGFRNFELLAR